MSIKEGLWVHLWESIFVLNLFPKKLSLGKVCALSNAFRWPAENNLHHFAFFLHGKPNVEFCQQRETRIINLAVVIAIGSLLTSNRLL